jgi:hypothetical protein
LKLKRGREFTTGEFFRRFAVVKERLDGIFMSLTGRYESLEDFARRLEDRLKFEGFPSNYLVGIDWENRAVSVLYRVGEELLPVATVFLTYREFPDGLNYGVGHEEYCVEEDVSPIVWNYETLRKIGEVER